MLRYAVRHRLGVIVCNFSRSIPFTSISQPSRQGKTLPFCISAKRGYVQFRTCHTYHINISTMHVISRPNYMYISIFMGMGMAAMTAKTTFSTFVSLKQLDMLNKIVGTFSSCVSSNYNSYFYRQRLC